MAHGTAPRAPHGAARTGKNRWCHFAFETGDAPTDLHRLSAQAGRPKERAGGSVVLAGPSPAPEPQKTEQNAVPARVITDAFPLPDAQYGRYCCSERGLVLLRGTHAAIANTPSGALIKAALTETGQRDPKSGALLAGLCP
jgi:hypothetical protein